MAKTARLCLARMAAWITRPGLSPPESSPSGGWPSVQMRSALVALILPDSPSWATITQPSALQYIQGPSKVFPIYRYSVSALAAAAGRSSWRPEAKSTAPSRPHWFRELAPVVTTRPSLSKPTVCHRPASKATTSCQFITLHWPTALSPAASSRQSAVRPRVKLPPQRTSITFSHRDTSHWPKLLSPVATTCPSLVRATEWRSPAATATTSVQPVTWHWPSRSRPAAATVPSAFRPRLWKPPAATCTMSVQSATAPRPYCRAPRFVTVPSPWSTRPWFRPRAASLASVISLAAASDPRVSPRRVTWPSFSWIREKVPATVLPSVVRAAARPSYRLSPVSRGLSPRTRLYQAPAQSRFS